MFSEGTSRHTLAFSWKLKRRNKKAGSATALSLDGRRGDFHIIETAAAPGFALWQQIRHKLDAGR